MNDQTFKKLELDKILDRLSRCCVTSYGKEMVERIKPSTDMTLVEQRMAETTEARRVLRVKGAPPFGGIRDIRGSLERSNKGAVLQPDELLAIADFLRGSKGLKDFCLASEQDIPAIKDLAGQIVPITALENILTRSITDEGEVADRASDKLYGLRQKIRVYQARIKDKLNEIIRSPGTRKLLQDPIVTIRDGRYVVPVKQEYRHQFPGLVHDQSASGATLFVEPMAVVEMNNQLRQTKAAERKEVELILRRLTERVSSVSEELTASQEAVARLDVIFAKGRLSEIMDGGAPKLNKDGRLEIVQGRHPLIEGEVVPVIIRLGRDFDTLVITGPNTGGKTVTLKTVGLFVLMAQCGLHLPAQSGTEIAIFRNIFADIGDEQSIEQSLSTFSSHMTNIIDIVRQADSKTLVLLDELGAGTDPTEGSALAMSILEYLHRQGVKTVATTHYSELKAFAYSTQGIENASVEFDVKTLRPTYHLMIGVPGGSNAFEIAARLGLPQNLVDRARQFLSGEQVKVAELIQRLEENQKVSARERQDAENIRRQLAAEREQLRERQLELENRRARVMREAHEEAARLVKEARREAEEMIKLLKDQFSRQLERANLEAARQARKQLAEQEQRLDEGKERYQEKSPGKTPKRLKPGMKVFIPRLNQNAYVLEEADNQGEVQVQAGIMKIKVKKEELRLIETSGREQWERSGVARLVFNKSSHISPELDLRGLTVAEAREKVDKYLDDAVLAGLTQVRLIHGKGTGALRSALNDWLKNHPQVAQFGLADLRQGGSGATEVTLKN